MSYASVTAHNALPLDQQPRPDTALLNTTPPTAAITADDISKLNLVAPDFKENPQTTTSEADIRPPTTVTSRGQDELETNKPMDMNHHEVKKPAHRINVWCGSVMEYLVRPNVAGGLLGLVNIGLLASVGRIFYVRPHLRRDAAAITSAVAAATAIITVEGAAAVRFRLTPQGQEMKMKNQSATVLHHLHEQIMRPGVLGGMIGLANVSVLGTIGYISYVHWNKPWDRKVVSAVTLGLLSLWGGEGYLVDHQFKGRH